MTDETQPAAGTGGSVDRRSFLRGSALAAGGLAVGAGAGVLGTRAASDTHQRAPGPSASATKPAEYFGDHQPGVADRAPAALRFTAYQLAAGVDRDRLHAGLKELGSASASMMAGRWISQQGSVGDGLRPDGLTVTLGVGRRAVSLAGVEAPPALNDLPAFRGDRLDPARSGGDLAVQVCAGDDLLVSSVARAVDRVLAGIARPKWMQRGFLPAAAAADPHATPRNLMGQRDGTDNPTGAKLDLAVWLADTDRPAWLVGGTYLVCRRIRMLLPEWEAQSPQRQASIVGRHIDTGAPLSGGSEHTAPDFTARTASGALAIPADAHVRLTHPANNGGATMLRRAYSYDEGYRPDGQPEAGLFFQAFQRDPQATFVPIQRKLADRDALTRLLVHESSAVFAVPPGASRGGFAGQTLFG